MALPARSPKGTTTTRTIAGAALGAAVLLAACAPSAPSLRAGVGLGEALGARTTPLAAHSIARDVPAHAALAALPPGAGEVIAVTERRDARGRASQRIVLSAGPGVRGENALTVAPAAGRRITAATVSREMRAAFDGASLPIDAAGRANAYGPYGMASGTVGGVPCHYAWQRIAGASDAGPAWRAGRGKAGRDVRLRLCGERLEASTVAGFMDRLVVGSGRRAAGHRLPTTPAYAIPRSDP